MKKKKKDEEVPGAEEEKEEDRGGHRGARDVNTVNCPPGKVLLHLTMPWETAVLSAWVCSGGRSAGSREEAGTYNPAAPGFFLFFNIRYSSSSILVVLMEELTTVSW